jgi:predicted RNA-binding protein YlqC (UPF0109 family)
MCDFKEFIETISKPVVNDPDAVVVREVEGANAIILELSVAPEDKGRIIGRQGRVVNAMRVLVRSKAARQGKRVTLEIV